MAAPLEARDRLRRLADDLEERCTRSACDPDARALYRAIANEARLHVRTLHLGDGLALALEAAYAHARFASWLDGDIAPEPALRTPESAKPTPTLAPLPIARTIPAQALNARQLANACGVPERTARRAIERGMRKGLAGFYRDGCRWYADRDAFDRLHGSGRIVAERCARSTVSK